MSFATTLLLDEASAQTAPVTASPAPSAPMLPVSNEPATASTAPAVLVAPEGDAPDLETFSLEGSASPKDHVVLKPPASTRWLLIGAGLAATGAFYGASYGIGALWPDAPGKKDLRIPVAGPFMDLAHTGCPKNDSNCSTFGLVIRTLFVSLDALGQAGGVGVILEGALFSPSGVEPPRAGQSNRRTRRAETASVIAVPWTDGQTGLGLGLAGRF